MSGLQHRGGEHAELSTPRTRRGSGPKEPAVVQCARAYRRARPLPLVPLARAHEAAHIPFGVLLHAGKATSGRQPPPQVGQHRSAQAVAQHHLSLQVQPFGPLSHPRSHRGCAQAQHSLERVISRIAAELAADSPSCCAAGLGAPALLTPELVAILESRSGNGVRKAPCCQVLIPF